MRRRAIAIILALCAQALSACSGLGHIGPSQLNLPASASMHAAPYPLPTPGFLVSLPSTSQVAFIDLATEQISQFIGVGFPAGEIVVHPTRPLAYLGEPSTVAVLDLQTRSIVKTFNVPADFSHLAIGLSGELHRCAADARPRCAGA